VLNPYLTQKKKREKMMRKVALQEQKKRKPHLSSPGKKKKEKKGGQFKGRRGKWSAPIGDGDPTLEERKAERGRADQSPTSNARGA